jgi:hypothetical protein
MSVFTNQINLLSQEATKLGVDFEDAYNNAIDRLRSNHPELDGKIEVWEDCVSVNTEDEERKEMLENSLEGEFIFCIEQELGIK